MTPTLTYSDIALRLALALLAGAAVGFNRGERGRAAGLRTTMLVSLAATLAMILANLLLVTAGKRPDSFVNIDPMRLPLGILTGMGFIGAGTVLHRKDSVIGITTAATLWCVTVIGLCFGSGQLIVGVVAALIALIVLEGLWLLDRSIPRDRHATLTLLLGSEGPTEHEIGQIVLTAGYNITISAVAYVQHSRHKRVTFEIQWHGNQAIFAPPAFVEDLSRRPGVLKLQWTP
jgi:putative Mg2+ transporter-C (MgtC) family protein